MPPSTPWLCQGYLLEVDSTKNLPVNLHVCYESRREALKSYQLIFPTPPPLVFEGPEPRPPSPFKPWLWGKRELEGEKKIIADSSHNLYISTFPRMFCTSISKRDRYSVGCLKQSLLTS